MQMVGRLSERVYVSCRPLLLSAPSSHASTFFFFNDTATTEIYTLSLHDALPISARRKERRLAAELRDSFQNCSQGPLTRCRSGSYPPPPWSAGGAELSAHRNRRSEEHTSELQSQFHLVCRLLLEKKK